jgi:hypothetical protein
MLVSSSLDNKPIKTPVLQRAMMSRIPHMIAVSLIHRLRRSPIFRKLFGSLSDLSDKKPNDLVPGRHCHEH